MLSNQGLWVEESLSHYLLKIKSGKNETFGLFSEYFKCQVQRTEILLFLNSLKTFSSTSQKIQFKPTQKKIKVEKVN